MNFAIHKHTNPDGTVVDVQLMFDSRRGYGRLIPISPRRTTQISIGKNLKVFGELKIEDFNVTIGDDVTLRNCLIMGNTKIGNGCSIGEVDGFTSTISGGCRIGAEADIIGNLGSDSVVGVMSSIHGSVTGRIGNSSKILVRDMLTLHHTVDIDSNCVVDIRSVAPKTKKACTFKVGDNSEVYLDYVNGNVEIGRDVKLGMPVKMSGVVSHYVRPSVEGITIPDGLSVQTYKCKLGPASLIFHGDEHSVIIDDDGHYHSSWPKGVPVTMDTLRDLAKQAWACDQQRLGVIRDMNARLEAFRRKLKGLFSEFRAEMAEDKD